MTFEEAKRILHPDTTRETVKELALDGVDAVKAAEQACLVACEAIDKVLAGQWTSVKDRLPERDRRVLVYIPKMNGSDCDIQISKGWGVSKYVTHWMPLPEPPKEVSE